MNNEKYVTLRMLL